MPGLIRMSLDTPAADRSESDPLASLIVHSEAEQPATAVAGAAVTDHRRLGSPFDSAVSWWARWVSAAVSAW